MPQQWTTHTVSEEGSLHFGTWFLDKFRTVYRNADAWNSSENSKSINTHRNLFLWVVQDSGFYT